MRDKHLYPPNWTELALQCKEHAHWTCEGCNTPIPREGVEMITRKGKKWRMYLCACHVNHDIENPQPELKALCLICHLQYDYDAKQIERRIQAEQKRHALLIAKAGYTPAKTRLKNIERYRKCKEKMTA